MREDGCRDRIGAQVLISAGLHLVGQVDDGAAVARDGQRHLDGLVPRRVDAGAGAERLEELVEGDGVLLDEVLREQPHLLGLLMRGGGALPLLGAHRDLLQQRGRDGERRGGG